MRRLPGGAAEFQLGAAASFVPLAETVTWWDDPHRDQAEAWFHLLLTPEARAAHVPRLMILRAVAGPLAGRLLRFEADAPLLSDVALAPDLVTGRFTDFHSQLTPLRHALDFIEHPQLGTWMLDLPTGALDIDAAWAAILGYRREDLDPFTHADWVALTQPEDARGFDAPELTDQLARGEVVHYVSRSRHAAGHWVWFMTCCRGALWDHDGRLLRVIGYDIDVTEHRMLLARTEDQRLVMQRVLDVMPSGQIVVDALGEITYLNPEAAEMIGVPPERAIGQTLVSLLPLDEGRDPLIAALSSHLPVRDLDLVLRTSAQTGLDAAVRHYLSDRPPPEAPPRRHLTAHFTRVPIIGKTFVSLTDMTTHVTQRNALEHSVEQARYFATHDMMTGLPDRYNFLRHLDEALSEAGPRMRPVAVMLIDIDNFKLLNDGMGHEKGDQLIKAAAQRLERALPDRARLARFGGDEFVIMVPDCSATEAALLAEDLRSRFADPLPFSLRHSMMSCSIGIGVFPQDATSAESLMRCADLAMYEAKALGRGQIRRFSHDLREQNQRRNAVVIVVQRALSDGGFHIVLQPKFDLTDLAHPVGAEVLLRLNDPELGAISPAEFIPIAEAQGLIPAVDREVVRLVGALRAGFCDLPLSINLSALTLSGPGFGDFLESLPDLARSGGLMVEVTETSFMGRLGAVRDTLHLLRRSGVGVAVDDFGIGHSSLAYLQSLPVQELKIDRSFVSALGRAQDPSQAIVRAILAMAEALGLTTVAEGVETTEQADWLMDHGCRLAQGFLLGRPVDPQEFQRIYLKSQEGAPPPWAGTAQNRRS